MIRYDRLWDTMTNRGMTQYKLIKFQWLQRRTDRTPEKKYARFYSHT